MCALGKRDTHGRYQLDPNEPPFTPDEMERALEMRKMSLHTRGRADNCPHTPRCVDIHECIENIAWFFRYHKEINSCATGKNSPR